MVLPALLPLHRLPSSAAQFRKARTRNLPHGTHTPYRGQADERLGVWDECDPFMQPQQHARKRRMTMMMIVVKTKDDEAKTRKQTTSRPAAARA